MEFIAQPISLGFLENSSQLGPLFTESFRQPKLLKWKRPRDGFVAVNCDGSFRSYNDTCGYGIIIRDQFGGFIQALAKHFQKSDMMLKNRQVDYGVTVLMIEMLAIRNGLRLAKNLGLTHVEIQSDSKIAISILRGQTNYPMECFDVFNDIVREAPYFVQLDFLFVYRETNQAADFLSKVLKCDGDLHLKCSSELPDQLQKILIEDSIGKVTLRF